MILQTSISTLIVSIGLINCVFGTSYSNVYVESEHPVRYYRQGIPYSYTPIAGPELSQLNTLPASLPGYVTPCVAPCVVSGPNFPAVEPHSGVLAYTQPRATLPVVVTPTKEDNTGYEYSYIVYDDRTGDHKAQRELSDGSIVRGEYSFLQPDGYIREVQYTADDIKGFNAVVKKFLPVEENTENKEKKELSHPCPETKHESLTEELKSTIEKHDDTHDHDLELEQDQKHEQPLDQGNNLPTTKNIHQKHHITHISEHHGHPHGHSQKHGHFTEHTKAKNHGKVDDISEESGSQENSAESSSEESHEVHKPTKTAVKHHKKSKHQSSEESYENASEEKPIHGKHGAHDLDIPDHEVLVPYHDVVRCVEAALKRAKQKPAALKEEPSPLTYIVLNTPC